TNPPSFDTPYPVHQGPVTGTYPPPMAGVQPPDKNRVITLVFPEQNKEECEKIAALMAKAAYKQEILNLADKVNDPTNEYGVVMTPLAVGVPITPGPEIDINTNGMTIYSAVSHTHHTGKLSVFSYSDFYALLQLYRNNRLSHSTF